MISACAWLLAGMLALQLSSFPPRSDLLVVLMVALAVALPFLRQRDIVWLLVGGSCFYLHSAVVVDSRLKPQFAGDSMLISVRVADFPRRNGSTTSFIATPLADGRIPPRIRLSWFEPPVSIRLGDVWRLEARLRELESLPLDRETAGGEQRADSAELSFDAATSLVTAAQAQTIAELREQVRQALAAIEEDAYGVCQECGQPIRRQRLEAVPWALLCVNCAENEEISSAALAAVESSRESDRGRLW